MQTKINGTKINEHTYLLIQNIVYLLTHAHTGSHACTHAHTHNDCVCTWSYQCIVCVCVCVHCDSHNANKENTCTCSRERHGQMRLYWFKKVSFKDCHCSYESREKGCVCDGEWNREFKICAAEKLLLIKTEIFLTVLRTNKNWTCNNI